MARGRPRGDRFFGLQAEAADILRQPRNTEHCDLKKIDFTEQLKRNIREYYLAGEVLGKGGFATVKVG